MVAESEPEGRLGRPPPSERTILALAERQHGVISAAQLSRNGLSGRSAQKRVTSGRLRRIYRGVYAVSGAPLSRDGSRMAAVLAGGEGALLARENGGALWGFTRADPFPMHILLPGSGRKGPPGVRIHRTRQLDPRDRTTLRGIPVTSVALTLVDLAETLPAQALARAVHEAEVLRLFNGRELDRFNGRRGAARLHALLQDPNLAGVTQEEFDDRFLHLCITHHLPPPRMHVHLAAGTRLLEVDALWADQRVCVELDGAQVHHTRRAFSSDRKRDLALAAEGYVTVRLTWAHVTREDARVGQQLSRLLCTREGTRRSPMSLT